MTIFLAQRPQPYCPTAVYLSLLPLSTVSMTLCPSALVTLLLPFVMSIAAVTEIAHLRTDWSLLPVMKSRSRVHPLPSVCLQVCYL